MLCTQIGCHRSPQNLEYPPFRGHLTSLMVTSQPSCMSNLSVYCSTNVPDRRLASGESEHPNPVIFTSLVSSISRITSSLSTASDGTMVDRSCTWLKKTSLLERLQVTTDSAGLHTLAPVGVREH